MISSKCNDKINDYLDKGYHSDCLGVIKINCIVKESIYAHISPFLRYAVEALHQIKEVSLPSKKIRISLL